MLRVAQGRRCNWLGRRLQSSSVRAAAATFQWARDGAGLEEAGSCTFSFVACCAGWSICRPVAPLYGLSHEGACFALSWETEVCIQEKKIFLVFLAPTPHMRRVGWVNATGWYSDTCAFVQVLASVPPHSFDDLPISSRIHVTHQGFVSSPISESY